MRLKLKPSKITKIAAILCLIAQIIPSLVLAEIFEIDVPEHKHSFVNGQDAVTIQGYGTTLDSYRPSLPVKSFFFEVPEDAYDISVNIKDIEFDKAIDTEDIFEMQPPMPANKDPSYRPPKRKLNQESRFPEGDYIYNGIKTLEGKKLVSITVFPAHYIYSSKKVVLYSKFVFDINYKTKPAKSNPNRRRGRADSPTKRLASEIISNYDQSSSTDEIKAEPAAATSGKNVPETSDLSGTDIKYVIITTESLRDSLEPLKDWKNQKGIHAEIYTVEGIYANSSGGDNPEKIRNFLISLENNYNIDWVLIGGDHSDVPARMAYSNDTYAGDGDYVPTDYYYSDLLGSYSPYDWDYDNDSKYGDDEDNIDWLPDAYVGRLPSSSNHTMQNMVSNIINYEKTPPQGNWSNKIILAGAKADDETDDANLMEYVRNDFVNAVMSYERLYYLDNFTKDYELTFANFESRADNGASMINWAGHGSYTSAASTKTGPTFVSTATSPTNGNKRPLVYADSCSTGGFDQATNLGETVIRNWGIGFVGASRVSWYCVGWDGPSYPYNQAHDYRFFEQLINYEKYRPGQALYDSKVDYLNDFASSYGPDDIYASRKNFYDYNLLGDPELPVWTQVPKNITISNTQYFSANNSNSFNVSVNYTSNGSAVVNATVALYNGVDVLETSQTGANGIASFPGVTTVSSKSINVTVTKPNHLPGFEQITLSPIDVELLSPIDQDFVNPDSISFVFNYSSETEVTTCSLVVDNETMVSYGNMSVGLNQTIQWDNPTGGNLSWGVQCSDNYGSTSSLSYENIEVFIMKNYDGNSTNLSEVEDLENVTDLVLERSIFGMINFTEPLNLSGGVDLDTKVTIGENLISIDSDSAPSLNRSATLTLYGVSFENPVIMRDGSLCEDCIIIDTSNNRIRFNVSHFSSYSATGATTISGKSNRFNGSLAGNLTAEGGNVTELNLTTTSSTARWQGFYGNVSGGLRLGDGIDIFYNFTDAEPVSVYSSQNNNFDFTLLNNGTAGDVDVVWGYATGNDQAIDIFLGKTNISNVSGAPSAELYPLGNDWNSTVLDNNSNTQKSDFIFGVNVQDNGNCYDGSFCDFELIVPADADSGEVYYFYAEIG